MSKSADPLPRLQAAEGPSGGVSLTAMERAMLWERMSGERLSNAERQRIMDGGEFQPPVPAILKPRQP